MGADHHAGSDFAHGYFISGRSAVRFSQSGGCRKRVSGSLSPKVYSLRTSRSIASQERGLQVACPPEEPISELGAGPQTP